MHTITVGDDWTDLLISWLNWLRAAGLSRGTIKLRSYQIRRFAAQCVRAPLAVDLDLLTHYLAQDGWSPSTRRSARDAIRGFYDWAHRTGRIADNPAVELRRIPVQTGKPRPAGEIAVKRGMKAQDPRVRLMIMLGAMQGLRCVEIARIHSTDVVDDLLGKSLRVHGKGNKIRIIPLADPVAYQLGQLPQGWAFPGHDDGHLSPAYVSKLISWALPEGITAHMLRHRFAGVAYKGTGFDIRAVQDLLGHSSVATTQIYTPVMPESLRLGVLAAAGMDAA